MAAIQYVCSPLQLCPGKVIVRGRYACRQKKSVAGTSAYRYSPRQVRPRTVAVICKGRNVLNEIAADSNWPLKVIAL